MKKRKMWDIREEKGTVEEGFVFWVSGGCLLTFSGGKVAHQEAVQPTGVRNENSYEIR